MPDAVTDASNTGGAIANAGKAIGEAGSNAAGAVGKFIETHPYISAGGAGAAGLLAGVLIHNASKKRQ